MIKAEQTNGGATRSRCLLLASFAMLSS